MNLQQKIEILNTSTFFKDLSLKEVTSLAKQATEKKFSKKSYIIAQGQPADAVYLIYTGLVRIYILNDEGKIIPIRIKGPLYIVGELNLFDNLSTTYIEAVQETQTLVFPKEIFISLILTNSRFAISLLKTITEKLRAANIHANEYVSTRLKERTWNILQTLSQHFPQKEIPLSQEELSLIIGASRAKVTKVLDILSQEKLVTLSHRKIHIL